MRVRSIKIAFVLGFTLAAVAGALLGRWWLCPPVVNSTQVEFKQTLADSPDEIERMIRASMAPKYLASRVDIAEGYKIYSITNGPSRWLFVLADTGPRGLPLRNLYCYQQVEPKSWLLRSYVPLWEHLFPESSDRELCIRTDNDRITVTFRGAVVYMGAAQIPATQKLKDSL